jgi:ABC-2 type transport system ATP-binding protein
MKSLELQDVSKSYNGTRACREVSLRLDEGEIFGLLGPNGAGKTTLLRLILDILTPDEGRILLDGSPMTREDRDRVGYLPEERGLYRKQRVLDVLVYFAMLKGLARREAREAALAALEAVGLGEVSRKKVEDLSKGMQQKVQIIGTLLHDPALLVLDEPFSGLDPVNTRLVKDMIRERRGPGRLVLLSTHQMAQAEALCDRVALIHEGSLVLYGELPKIRARWAEREGELASLEEIFVRVVREPRP